MPAPARADGLAAGAGPRSSYRVRPTAAIRARPSPRRRQVASRAVLGFAALSLAAGASATPTLPYTPTTILLPPDGTGDRTAYIFSPSGDTPDAVDFLSLDISSLKGSSLEPTKLSSTLPFLTASGGDCTTFAPAMLRNGTIAVVAGDCVVGATSTLWTYTPSSPSSSPTWTQVPLAAASTWDNAQSGPYHLGGLLTFSAELSPVLSEPTLYLYGGMCPSQSTSSPSNWQSSATYSNRMLRLTPPGPNSAPSSPYTLNYAPATGQQPPVAEAGFTLTELTPSVSNRSSIVTQQTTHVLLGGHTQSAFVNASTAALYSLPEETWAFVHIAAPAAPKADLARGVAAASVDSRSGHSAVLSEDGTRLVVYGGWVGDVNTAAEPALAVVRVGVGLGDWGWEVPEEQPGGAGVYGHGAVVLPGNVMMVYGGFGIGEGGLGRRGVEARFYNITSGTWAEEYVSPLAGKGDGGGGSGNGSGSGSGSGGSVHGGGGSSSSPGGQTGDTPSSEDDSSKKRKIGLGVGIGVGVLVLIALTALTARWLRHRRQRRARRDETLRNLAQGVNGSLPRGIGEDGEMLEHEHSMGMFPWTAAAAREWYTGGDDPYQQGRRSLGYETLRGGARSAPSLYMPPPPSASSFSSRPRGAKGLYQPTNSSGYDFTPLSGAPNRIDPIYEADEDEDGDLGRTCPLSPDREDRDDDDPFLTPTLQTPVGGLFPRSGGGSSTPPPPPTTTTTNGQEQHPDVQGWVSDVDAAASLPRAPPTITTTQPPLSPTGGRISPLRHAPSTSKSKSPRPSLVSTLTPDTSSASSDANSARTGSNLSERSAAAFSFTQSAAGAGAEDRLLLSRLRTTLATTTTAAAAGADGRGGSSGSGNSGSGNSYNTARSSFAALQAEGPSLLHQPTRRRRNSDLGVAAAAGGEDGGDDDEEGYVYVPGSPSKSKPRRSWFGSLRRVFSGGTAESSREDVAGSSSAEGGGLLWHGETGVGSDFDTGLGGGGMLQRRRQQQLGWGEEEEEDLERAAERRTVQIMFTVPRETLRVVNAEVEREESVLIVDPEDEESTQGQSSTGEPDAGLLTPTPTPAGGHDDPKGKSVDTTPRQPSTTTPGRLSPSPLPPTTPGGRLSPAPPTPGRASPSPTPGRASPSPSARTSSFTTTHTVNTVHTTTLHTAEAVRLERPRTRVLAMVESFESRSSREGSPSPERARTPASSIGGGN